MDLQFEKKYKTKEIFINNSDAEEESPSKKHSPLNFDDKSFKFHRSKTIVKRPQPSEDMDIE